MNAIANRFFKLVYIFALIAVALSLPIYVLSSIDYERLVDTSYKAKCLDNGEYVVLQGSQYNEVYVFNEVLLRVTTYTDVREKLNFYCQYHDEIQHHIAAYIKSETPDERRRANIEYFQFQDRVISNVHPYPPLYQLEVVSEEIQPYIIFGPVVDWLTGAVLVFFLLQIARMSYVYVVFGELVWHPFRLRRNH